LRAEVRYNSSRLDFLAETNNGPVWIETKGCTLCRNGVALSPDAPTSRGKRHLEHLREIRMNGERAAVVVLVFRPDAEAFAPNAQTDPGFAEAFWSAVDAGVKVYPLLLEFRPPILGFKGAIPVRKSG
jgi:sugar fermentation stimulation protein A